MPGVRYLTLSDGSAMSVGKSSSSPRGKVSWRRFAIVAVPAVAVAGILVGLTAEGALASSISVSGQEFVITIDSVAFNTEIPADKFALPDEIKALVNKK